MHLDGLDDVFLTYACSVLADTDKGLSGSRIVEYCSAFGVRYGRDIPQSNYPFNPHTLNKRSALKQNLNAFTAEEQFHIIDELCRLEKFSDSGEAQKLLEELYAKYGDLASIDILDSPVVKETKHWLQDYPDALNQFESSLKKYESGVYQRNTLDDMRLSFELLVKDLLSNDKSLENQLSGIGQILDNAGISKELKNIYPKLVDLYTNYHNGHVKHDDSFNPEELGFVIELTSLMMKFLIKANGNSV